MATEKYDMASQTTSRPASPEQVRRRIWFVAAFAISLLLTVFFGRPAKVRSRADVNRAVVSAMKVEIPPPPPKPKRNRQIGSASQPTATNHSLVVEPPSIEATNKAPPTQASSSQASPTPEPTSPAPMTVPRDVSSVETIQPVLPPPPSFTVSVDLKSEAARWQILRAQNPEALFPGSEMWNFQTRRLGAATYTAPRAQSLKEVSRALFATDRYWLKIWSLNPQLQNADQVPQGFEIRLREQP